MRWTVFFTAWILNTTLSAVATAESPEIEVRIVEVKDDTFTIASADGTMEIHNDHAKAVRVRNGKSEIKLSNDVVLIILNRPGKADTEWRELHPSNKRVTSPRPTTVKTELQPRSNNVSPAKLQAYARELNELVSKARPGIESGGDAGDVRSVEFLIRDINNAVAEGISKPSLLPNLASVDRVRSLARSAPQRVAARNQRIAERNRQIQDIQLEIRMLSQELQANQTWPTDSGYRRRSQIDRELKKLRTKQAQLQETARNEATHYADLMKQSQL